MKLIAAVLALALFPTIARAEPWIGNDSDPDSRIHWEGAFGLRVGSFPVGQFSGIGIGMHFDAGVRFDRLALFGEYSVLSLSSDGTVDSNPSDPTYESSGTSGPPPTNYADLSGTAHRWGLNARYSVGKLAATGVPIRGDFWVEAGVGRQEIDWDGGGELTRPDVSFGFGGQMSFRFGEHQDRHGGLYYALRVTVAHQPAGTVIGPAACAGPCDEPTRPSDLDRSYMFNMGFLFGN